MIILSLKQLPHTEQHNYAHQILTDALKKIYNIDYSENSVYKSEYGKPSLINYPNIKYNLSHSDGITACYIGKYEAGIDVEPVRKYRHQVIRRSFSESEKLFMEKSQNKDLDFFRLWTLKESYVKAIGIGISYPLNTVEFDLSDTQIKSNIDNCIFRQHIIQNRFVLSLCLLNPNTT